MWAAWLAQAKHYLINKKKKRKVNEHQAINLRVSPWLRTLEVTYEDPKE